MCLSCIPHGYTQRAPPKLVPFSPEDSLTSEQEESLEQKFWRRDMFRMFAREFVNIPFLTWKRINTLSSTLRTKDYIRTLRGILRSFKQENIGRFQYDYLRTLEKIPIIRQRQYIMSSLQHARTEQSLFIILSDPMARFLAKNKPNKLERYRLFEREMTQQFAQKKAFFANLLSWLKR